MRMIGHLDGEATAKKFSDYLYAERIENQVEAEKDGIWAIWILAEEHLDRAKELLTAFVQNPNDPKFDKSERIARSLRDQKQKDQEAFEKRQKGRRHLFRPLGGYGFGPLTFVLMLMCVVVFVLTGFGTNRNAMAPLFISEFDYSGSGLALISQRLRNGFQEVRHGEVWRILTPMLIHWDPLHILFNMLWLMDLGSMIEGRQSSWTLGILVVVFAAISNVGQYLVSGPIFGGMSGVVYGLLGYIWIRGKRDPGSGLFLHPSTVTMMIIWFFLGFTPLLGHIANTAHGAGLVTGMLWGFLSSLRYR